MVMRLDVLTDGRHFYLDQFSFRLMFKILRKAFSLTVIFIRSNPAWNTFLLFYKFSVLMMIHICKLDGERGGFLAIFGCFVAVTRSSLYYKFNAIACAPISLRSYQIFVPPGYETEQYNISLVIASYRTLSVVRSKGFYYFNILHLVNVFKRQGYWRVCLRWYMVYI